MNHKSKTCFQDLHFIIFTTEFFAYQKSEKYTIVPVCIYSCNHFFGTHSFRKSYIVDIKKYVSLRISGGFQIKTIRAAPNLFLDRKKTPFYSQFVHIFLNTLTSTNSFSLGFF